MVSDASPVASGGWAQVGPTRLADTFAPCFSLILQLRASDALGPADTLRERIKNLLARVEREARAEAVPADDVRLAKFAVVAFIDEAVMAAEWSGRELWLARPLQLELFDRTDAGVHFFVELENLRTQGPARAEVMEVYYLCLTLGFKGKYRIFEQEQLRVLIEAVHEELARTPGFAARDLSPHGTARERVVGDARRRLPTWAILAVTAAVVVVIYLVFTVLISSAAGRVAETVELL